MTEFIKVIQVKSTIGVPDKLRKTVMGLGLHGIGKQKIHPDNNCMRGMINQVSHLVKYELVASKEDSK